MECSLWSQDNIVGWRQLWLHFTNYNPFNLIPYKLMKWKSLWYWKKVYCHLKQTANVFVKNNKTALVNPPRMKERSWVGGHQKGNSCDQFHIPKLTSLLQCSVLLQRHLASSLTSARKRSTSRQPLSACSTTGAIFKSPIHHNSDGMGHRGALPLSIGSLWSY